jgi:hypothetical protein
MYLKLILCYVKKENQQEFTERQCAWNEIKEVNGLIFQLGGWDTLDEEVACKLALWENKELYTDFQLNLHDALARKAGHQHLYYKLATDFFLPQQTLSPGGGLPGIIGSSSFLRVADCRVHAGHLDYFLQAQQEIWIPAMQQAAGMLGGFFSQHETDSNRFLVSTFWRSRMQHEDYVKNMLPALREKARVADTVSNIKSYYVQLHPEWIAIGDAAQNVVAGF